MSWATATRSIRKCKTRIEKIGGSLVDTEPTAWGLDVQIWNLLWTGEEAMKKGIPILKKAGFESVKDLPKAERKRKSDASPVEFCRRSLAGGNV